MAFEGMFDVEVSFHVSGAPGELDRENAENVKSRIVAAMRRAAREVASDVEVFAYDLMTGHCHNGDGTACQLAAIRNGE